MVSVELETHEIRSRKEFEGLKHARAGVIVNVDTPTSRATAHRPSCEYLSVGHFETKVIANEGRTGGYYYFLRAKDARTALGAEFCEVCR